METSSIVEEQSPKKRGFWLSAFLIFMFIANPLTAFTYFSNPEAIIQVYPKVTIGMLYFMGVMAIVNVVLAAGIWRWKKWGVYGFYCVVATAFCINLYVGLGLAGSLMGLMGAVIIFITTKKRWEVFS